MKLFWYVAVIIFMFIQCRTRAHLMLQIRTFQKLVTFILAGVLVAGGAFVIIRASQAHAGAVAVTIVAINQITPRLVRLITRFESHRTESSYASSVYLKVTAIRWVNTAVVLWFIRPFSSVLQDGDHLLGAVTALFFAEIVQRPILQLVDIWGQFKRHYLAPRAVDQRRMNMSFYAGTYAIGERYTEITKVLFLTFFYGTLMPATFFYASAILIVYYWMDKYCILRTWRQAPRINAEISIVSMYVFLITVMAYAVMASYSIAQFPFDNACMDDVGNNQEFTTTVTNLEGVFEEVIVPENVQYYKFCNQAMFDRSSFPALPEFQPEGQKWMTHDQEILATLFGWGSVGVIVIVGITFLEYFIRKRVLPLFIPIFSVRLCHQISSLVTHCLICSICNYNQAQEESPNARRFSDVHTIYAYVPQVEIPGYAYPALLCDIDDSYYDLVGWNDPNYIGYDKYNMIYDVDERSDSAFHIIQKWNP